MSFINLKRLNHFIYRCFRVTQRNPKKFLVASLLLILFLGSNVPKMRFLLSTDDLVGDGIPSSDRLKELKKNFPEGPNSLLVLTPKASRGPFTASELCKIRRWLSDERISSDDLIDVQSPYDVRRSSDPSNPKVLLYPLLLELDCDHPELAQQSLAEKWERVRHSPWGFLLTDKTGRDFSIQFTFRETPEFKFGNFNPQAVSDLRARFSKTVLPELKETQYYWVGTADYQHATHEGLQWGSKLNLGMLIFLMIAIRLCYGSWKAGFVFNISLISAAAIVYGAKGLLHSPFDVMSNSIFLMLGISTLQDFIFLLGDQLEYGTSWRSSVRRLLLPSFYTSLTTVIGFLSLCTSNLGIIHRLGFWSAVGALVEWILIFFVLPAIIKVFGKPKPWVNPDKAYIANFVRGWSKKKISSKLARGSLLVYPVAVFAMFHLNVNDSSHYLFKKDNQLRAGLEYLLDSRDWIGSVSLVFSRDLEKAQKEAIYQKFSTSKIFQDHVTGVESVQKQLAYLSEGQSSDRVALIRSDYDSSKISERLIAGREDERMLLYVNKADVDTLVGLQNELKNYCGEKDCNLVGSLMSYAEFASLITKTLLESMLLCMALVTLVICALAFSMKQSAQIGPLLLSSFWGPMLMLGLEGIFQLKINFLTCIFASVLVGLTGDNGIQYLFGAKKKNLEAGVLKRGSASILTSVMMFAASFIFLGSYFDPQKKFGVLLAGGLLASLVGDLWILKGLKKNN